MIYRIKKLTESNGDSFFEERMEIILRSCTYLVPTIGLNFFTGKPSLQKLVIDVKKRDHCSLCNAMINVIMYHGQQFN
jgi:hypothetical protein